MKTSATLFRAGYLGPNNLVSIYVLTLSSRLKKNKQKHMYLEGN